MKKIARRLLSVLLSLSLFTALTVTSAFAAENTEDLEPLLTVSDTYIENEPFSDPFNLSTRASTRTLVDLSSYSSIKLAWTISGEGTGYSVYRYKTNTTQITVKFSCSPTCSMTVSLYDYSTGSRVGVSTKSVGSSKKSFTFTNLSSGTSYYFKITNNSTTDGTISGTISS